jgi:serine/threonine protein phosphatase PrpC
MVMQEHCPAGPSVVSDCARVSLTGTRHGNLNQDIAFTRQEGAGVVAAVFDGHGLLGEAAAAAAAAALERTCDHWDTAFPAAKLASDLAFTMPVRELFADLNKAVLHAHDTAPPA